VDLLIFSLLLLACLAFAVFGLNHEKFKEGQILVLSGIAGLTVGFLISVIDDQDTLTVVIMTCVFGVAFLTAAVLGLTLTKCRG
jgi:FtsH-binding integral membrane protein